MNANKDTLGREIANFIRHYDDEHEELYHEMETSFRKEVLEQAFPEDDYSFTELNLAEEIEELIQNTDCSALVQWLEDLSEWEFDKEHDAMMYTEEEVLDISRDAENLLRQLDTALSA